MGVEKMGPIEQLQAAGEFDLHRLMWHGRCATGRQRDVSRIYIFP
jgi:hypothetical protein